jgi:hypothetical protein
MTTKRFFSRAALVLLIAAATAFALGAGARAHRYRFEDEEEEETPFDAARLYFEYNSTDNDLGAQLFVDGDAWDRLELTDPRDRTLLNISARGSLGKLGLTELFWETDEPSPEEVLTLFREGEYEVEGETVEGEELESELVLSHDLPPAPVILVPATADDVLDRAAAVIHWQAIPGIASLEIIVENEEADNEMLVPLPAAATSLHIPMEYLELETDYKVEVIAIGENGNKTIAEREFVSGP